MKIMLMFLCEFFGFCLVEGIYIYYAPRFVRYCYFKQPLCRWIFQMNAVYCIEWVKKKGRADSSNRAYKTRQWEGHSFSLVSDRFSVKMRNSSFQDFLLSCVYMPRNSRIIFLSYKYILIEAVLLFVIRHTRAYDTWLEFQFSVFLSLLIRLTSFFLPSWFVTMMLMWWKLTCIVDIFDWCESRLSVCNFENTCIR